MLKNVLRIHLVCVLYGILTCGQGVKNVQLSKWATSILQEGTSVIALQTIEPGFDLSDEEIEKFKLWPNGIISYYIDDFSFDFDDRPTEEVVVLHELDTRWYTLLGTPSKHSKYKVIRDRIRTYLDMFSGITGVHFMELPSPLIDEKARWVLFVNRRGLLGCADHSTLNFTNEGVQKVVLGYDCISTGGELGDVALSIVGVPKQHNAPDRNDYIILSDKKIMPGKEYLFKQLTDSEWLFHELEYDFSSITHFHFHEHSVDGYATIYPRQPVDIQVGEVDGLSYTDVLKVRMLYNYISRKKHSSAKAPECNKLFKPGSNFDKYWPREDDAEPRRKPQKYLVAIGEGGNDTQNEDTKEQGGDKKEDDHSESETEGPNVTENNQNDTNNQTESTSQKGEENYTRMLHNRRTTRNKLRSDTKLKYIKNVH